MENINISRKVVEQSNIAKVINDIIVPDIKPDIINVIAINGIPYIYKEECEKGKIKVEGAVDVYISYLSVDGDTRSIQTTLNFSHVLENNEIKDNSYVKYELEIVGLNAKVINERKVNIDGEISIRYIVSDIQNIEINTNSFENIPKLQVQEDTIQMKSLVGRNVVKSSLKEDMSIESSEEIAEILKVDINVNNFENKISHNKVLAKAEVNIEIIYMTETGVMGEIKNTFPIMNFVEIENVKEDDIVEFEYIIKNILVKLNNRDRNSVTVQIEFCVYTEVYESKEIKIIKDAYSLSNDLELSFKKLQLNNENEKEVVEVFDSVKFENIKRIVSVENKKIVILKQDAFNIEGEITLGVYYETIDKIGLNFKEIRIPFVTKYKNECIFKFYSVNFNLENENINFSIKLLIRYVNIVSNEIDIIDGIKLKENQKLDDYSAIVYSVKRNDTIWKIAKEFKITVDNLKKINDIDDDGKICLGDKLYILK